MIALKKSSRYSWQLALIGPLSLFIIGRIGYGAVFSPLHDAPSYQLAFIVFFCLAGGACFFSGVLYAGGAGKGLPTKASALLPDQPYRILFVEELGNPMDTKRRVNLFLLPLVYKTVEKQQEVKRLLVEWSGVTKPPKAGDVYTILTDEANKNRELLGRIANEVKVTGGTAVFA
ncbi:MAG: hypothetical protein A3A22_01490 [Candidatus Taylorbacteria bacterium RIFCSPLOWO2_01_FULL_45_34b]|nr:MAG: hypothetical protein A3A22_01490 [Candidatus Taylorbacteria bacterium RIFCSPLOWO2_01_FULL_45_34b]